MTHCHTALIDVFLISPSIDVTDVTVNGSRLAAPGAGKSLSVSMSPCQVSVSYALYAVSAALSLPASDHASLTHFTWDQDRHQQDQNMESDYIYRVDNVLNCWFSISMVI